MKRLYKTGIFVLCTAFIIFCGTKVVQGAEEADTAEQIQGELLSELDFGQVQRMLDELLGTESFSFQEALKKLINGEEAISKETVQEFLRGLFFSGFERERELFAKILVLVILAAVFTNFASVFENGQVGDVSFYVVYILLFTLLMDSFYEKTRSLHRTISWIVEFMKALSPAYFMTVAASSGALSAAVFYEGVLLLVWLVEWLLLTLILPGANLYVLLCMVNHLSKEDMLSKMAELLETMINWSLKTMLGAVLGLQAVRGLVAPAMDAIKRTALGRTAGAIPAVGNAVNAVTELILAGALLVKNCLGAMAVVVLLLAGAGPVIHYGLLSLSFRFLGAVAQPVSDKRIVGCLGTMGEGCALLLRIMLTAEILCVLTFIVLMASVGG